MRISESRTGGLGGTHLLRSFCHQPLLIDTGCRPASPPERLKPRIGSSPTATSLFSRTDFPQIAMAWMRQRAKKQPAVEKRFMLWGFPRQLPSPKLRLSPRASQEGDGPSRGETFVGGTGRAALTVPRMATALSPSPFAEPEPRVPLSRAGLARPPSLGGTRSAASNSELQITGACWHISGSIMGLYTHTIDRRRPIGNYEN
jgi:hypothetical protein